MLNRWQDSYNSKLTTPQDAVKLISSGDSIVIPFSNGIPPALMEALASRLNNSDIGDIQLWGGLNARASSIYDFDLADKMLIINSFIGEHVRKGTQEGVFTFSPLRLSEFVRAVLLNPSPCTVVHQVAPMDEHGFFSTGTNCDYAWESAKVHPNRHHLILEVNEHMPRTFGNNQYHISEVSAVIENHQPLHCLADNGVQPIDETIGRYIAEKVEDGSCLQLGIGRIPNAVARFLKDKKNLGVHTEMMVDAMMDLYEAGAITCARKNFYPYRFIATFILGSQKLYDFVNNNPMIEMLSATYVNNPAVIARNDKVVSVNSTLEVDLGGQCNSEAIGYRPYSGTGGQLDFVQGAARSRGGKSFLTLYSTYTDKQGTPHSRIVPRLSDGGTVTVPRTDVDHVVTEYGIATLKGQHIRKRVEELINIAHPDFRDQLRFEAKQMNYIP
ncbi:MAG: acetyl-CoA hydrolase [Syntrophomonadaceae bacterium]|nr:acetyl-CoA hydrolase [Syntrophomonadaceae bacterium]